MHVIIVGGGEIGFSLAKALAVGHDVFVIDQAPAVADRFEALDVQFLLGTGTSADVLKRAGIEHAGILVACTGLDEVNIVTCAIGNRLDRRAPSASSPTRISSSSRSACPDDSGERIRRIDSMAIVAATWLVVAHCAAVPFVWAGLPPIGALFESMSVLPRRARQRSATSVPSDAACFSGAR